MATSIARWLIDENTDPTIADDTGNSNDLTITDDGVDSGWTSNAAGYGWEITKSPSTSSAVAELNDVSANGNIASTFNGATEASLLLVTEDILGTSNQDRVFAIGKTTSNGEIAVVVNTTQLRVRWSNDNAIGGEHRYSLPSTGSAVVIAILFDSTEADQEDRVKVYYDDVREYMIDVASSDIIEQNTPLVINSLHSVSLLNRPDGNRSAQGVIYYAELFSDLLTSSEITSASTSLLLNNDTEAISSEEVMLAFGFTVASTFEDVTFQFTKASEIANSWFNGAWWADPWFGTGWFGATSAIDFPVDPATVVITAQDVTFGGSSYDVTMDADGFSVSLTFTPASVEKDFTAEAFSVDITATAVTFSIDYNTAEFIISNSTTFDGKNIEYGVDICYNSGTDLGYTVVSRVDIDSVLLDGIFGTAPQPYEIRKYVGSVTLPSKTVIEFDGTNWHIISTTNLGI